MPKRSFTGPYSSLSNPQIPYRPTGGAYMWEPIPLTETRTHVNVDAYMDQIVQDPMFQLLNPQTQPENSEDFNLAFRNQIKATINPAICLLHPTPDDPTIRYAIMKSVGNIPTLHIRFWYGPHGPHIGYNFHLYDPKTNNAVYAPNGLVVQYFEYGHWHELVSFPEILRRCRELPAIPRFLLPEKWHTNPGTLVRFSDGLGGPVVGEISVPHAPVGIHPHYESFFSHNEAFVNSFPS